MHAYTRSFARFIGCIFIVTDAVVGTVLRPLEYLVLRAPLAAARVRLAREYPHAVQILVRKIG